MDRWRDLSDWFYLHRGCRQGDPLPPYLFIDLDYAEILAVFIRDTENIKDIKIENAEVLIFTVC